MRTTIGEHGFRFLLALARAHGHGWAAYATDEDAEVAEERSFESIAERIHMRMLAAEAELFKGADLGLRPSLEHRTASGRLRWKVSRDCWEISAWRAGAALGGVAGDVCVASVEKSGAAFSVRVGSAISSGAALALARALSESTALCEMMNSDEEWVDGFAQGIAKALAIPTPATDEDYEVQSRNVLARLAEYTVSSDAAQRNNCQSV